MRARALENRELRALAPNHEPIDGVRHVTLASAGPIALSIRYTPIAENNSSAEA